MFLDAKKRVLYVGRAVSLKKRVLNYFQKNLLDPRIKEMVSLARDIKYKKSENLLDAIVLEANLIKKYWPKYNIKDKDDRSFVYVMISKKDDFPKPVIARGREIENLKFKIEKFYTFGPYQSLYLIKNALKIIRKIFPYSNCLPVGRPGKIGSGKPCFDYQIGLCPGACVGAISKEDYKKNIENIALLLKGNKKRLLKKLKKENPNQAKALAHIQDVTLVNEKEIKSSVLRIEGYDVSHLAGKETYGSMVVFTNGDADKNQYRLFKIKNAPANDDLRALEEMTLRRFKHGEWQKPDLILLDGGRPQVSFVSKTLRNKNINIPLVGISKFGGDELVFPLGMKKPTRELIENTKGTLLKVREEAHRFALKSSRKNRKIS